MQSKLKDKSFKSSQYNFFIKYDKNTMLAFNGVSKAIGKFSSEQYTVIKKILAQPDEAVFSLRDGMKIKHYLLNNGFVIPYENDEFKILKQRNIDGIQSFESMNLILLPTLDCNFNCFYCYEDHSSIKMNADVLARIKNWGAQTLPKYRSLNLSWFGGEPLLEKNIIIELSQFFHDLCKKYHMGFYNMITTNGYLLNSEMIRSLCNIGINIFNITLDGPQYWHNKFRTHQNKNDSFEKITKGIISLATSFPKVRINVRVNYNNKNFNAIPELFEFFPNKIRGQIFFLFREIFGMNTNKLCLTDENNESEYYKMAYQKGYGLSLGESLCGPKETYCYADKKGSFVINPVGDVFKCSVCKFSSDSRMGFLSKDGKIIWDDEYLSKWNRINGFDDPECRICKYLPLCMGGCRALRLEKKIFDNCTQPFEHIEQFVKQSYDRKKFL